MNADDGQNASPGRLSSSCLPAVPLMSCRSWRDIHEAVWEARRKHPWQGAFSDKAVFNVLRKELEEVAAAMLAEDERQIRRELAQLCAIAVKRMERD